MFPALVKYLFEQKRMTATRMWLQRMGKQSVAISVADNNLHLDIDGDQKVWAAGKILKVLKEEATPLGVLWELMHYLPQDPSTYINSSLNESYGLSLEDTPFILTKYGKLAALTKAVDIALSEEVGTVKLSKDKTRSYLYLNTEFAKTLLLNRLVLYMSNSIEIENDGRSST